MSLSPLLISGLNGRIIRLLGIIWYIASPRVGLYRTTQHYGAHVQHCQEGTLPPTTSACIPIVHLSCLNFRTVSMLYICITCVNCSTRYSVRFCLFIILVLRIAWGHFDNLIHYVGVSHTFPFHSIVFNYTLLR